MTNEISKEWLKAYCKEHGYYNTPSLNDKLFLHFKELDRIKNRDTGLRRSRDWRVPGAALPLRAAEHDRRHPAGPPALYFHAQHIQQQHQQAGAPRGADRSADGAGVRRDNNWSFLA
eukprot:CAMPEP_0197576170 /NCGR_PEP_ID=MMETSP1326-20131121/1286_1 /TAXON_ID=1155430 /ORGANISM="Genus nov. species nov., Strain RCC2288" /LENGTH=116 /DNA_ID=CAMNT_0043139033 /DNA_START=491 /DNA_END=841 /DNA_ORIENTATION=+